MAASAGIVEHDWAHRVDRASGGWQARLELQIERRNERTILTRRRHIGPLVVQRPFYPEGAEVCHLYVLHPPGGLVGGDELSLDLSVRSGAALITTPSAAKVYRALNAPARQRSALSVGAGASLEWLPTETIVFDRASFRGSVSVELADDSRFIGWDAVCFGRVASGESFERGTYRQSLQVRKAGELVLDEPTVALPGSTARNGAFGFAGRSIAATVVASPAGPREEDAVAEAIDTRHAGVTTLGDVLVVRALCESATELRSILVRVWEILRPLVIGRAACPPRIWRT